MLQLQKQTTQAIKEALNTKQAKEIREAVSIAYNSKQRMISKSIRVGKFTTKYTIQPSLLTSITSELTALKVADCENNAEKAAMTMIGNVGCALWLEAITTGSKVNLSHLVTNKLNALYLHPSLVSLYELDDQCVTINCKHPSLIAPNCKKRINAKVVLPTSIDYAIWNLSCELSVSTDEVLNFFMFKYRLLRSDTSNGEMIKEGNDMSFYFREIVIHSLSKRHYNLSKLRKEFNEYQSVKAEAA
ncbi:hypothetical protein [Photobacterium leiognathi]|uniref:hypothetical protein n=1 Tax=Photobacterium leiognathi TaxID=553611 RepID=UPI00298146A6|nr:hypothetical protein [Photobacterium leiognathi]